MASLAVHSVRLAIFYMQTHEHIYLTFTWDRWSIFFTWYIQQFKWSISLLDQEKEVNYHCIVTNWHQLFGFLYTREKTYYSYCQCSKKYKLYNELLEVCWNKMRDNEISRRCLHRNHLNVEFELCVYVFLFYLNGCMIF